MIEQSITKLAVSIINLTMSQWNIKMKNVQNIYTNPWAHIGHTEYHVHWK